MRLKIVVIYVLMIISAVAHDEFNIPIISSNHPQANMWGFGNGIFEENGESLVLNRALTSGMVVFDVGANIGLWSKMALQYESSIQLFAFEPQEKIFQDLVSNIKSPSSYLYKCALSNLVGRDRFYAHDGLESEGSGFFSRPCLRHADIITEVETDTIDHFCETHNISKIGFLKIDTEGGELKVLQGAFDMLKENRIVFVQFEYGGTYLDVPITLKNVMQLLTQCGYVIFRLSPEGIIHISSWENSLENYQYANYFAVVKSLVPDCELVMGL